MTIHQTSMKEYYMVSKQSRIEAENERLRNEILLDKEHPFYEGIKADIRDKIKGSLESRASDVLYFCDESLSESDEAIKNITLLQGKILGHSQTPTRVHASHNHITLAYGDRDRIEHLKIVDQILTPVCVKRKAHTTCTYQGVTYQFDKNGSLLSDSEHSHSGKIYEYLKECPPVLDSRPHGHELFLLHPDSLSILSPLFPTPRNVPTPKSFEKISHSDSQYLYVENEEKEVSLFSKRSHAFLPHTFENASPWGNDTLILGENMIVYDRKHGRIECSTPENVLTIFEEQEDQDSPLAIAPLSEKHILIHMPQSLYIYNIQENTCPLILKFEEELLTYVVPTGEHLSFWTITDEGRIEKWGVAP